MKIVWSPDAAVDLEAIGDFVSKDKPDAALKLVRTLFAGIHSLKLMPQRGTPGRIESTRELVIAPYIIVYEIVGRRVSILHIITGRRTGRHHNESTGRTQALKGESGAPICCLRSGSPPRIHEPLRVII